MSEEERSFESARELFEALATPNAIERRKVLAWVAGHPAESIALGAENGRDVVDALIGLVGAGLDYSYWEDVAITIGAFDAPRVTEFFVDMLARTTEAEAAFDAASALGRRQRDAVRDRLVRILLSDGPPERAVAAAELLVGEPGLPDAAAVRVAALEEDRDPPALTPKTVKAWVAELEGPFGPRARDRLEEQGTAAVRSLGERWDDLDDEDRQWLIDWASGFAPREARPLVARALETGPEALALTALESIVRLDQGAIDPDLLARWADVDDPKLRAAAIAAGAPGDRGAPALNAPGADPELVIAAIGRLAERAGSDAVETIAPHLESDSLDVRTAARTAIVALGPDAIEALRPLVHSSRAEVRAAAVRALLDLGDDEWLAGELLDDGV